MKEKILNAIKECAKENGGLPLGWQKFSKETGISKNDLYKFWSNFTDAQKEAGFESRKFQVAYAEDFLLTKFCSLIRELSKYPVHADLVHKRHNDSNFPTHGCFNQLGTTKKDRIKKILEFAKEKKCLDVVNLLNGMGVDYDVDEVSGKTIDCLGEVYIFKSGRYYKIGKTKDTVRRGSEIRVLLPEKLELIHSIRTDDPTGIEAYWHKRFQSKRKNGEWFDLNSMDIKAFKAWKKIV